MGTHEPALRNVSDTALWVAMYRAQESERQDALFHDPYARLLAGERGARIAAAASFTSKHAWSMIARTWLVDQIVTEQVGQGADMVINLAAGLDARPYRMALPASLRWVEVDLPGILGYKESLLGEATPCCRLQRERCDLGDAAARRALFERLGLEARRALIITEGLLIYLGDDAVAGLARDLAAQPSFEHWAFDLASPGLLRMMQKKTGAKLAQAGAAFRFAPPQGPNFFLPLGWKPLTVQSILHAASRLHRLTWPLRLAAVLPQSHPGKGNRPWSGVCHMERHQFTVKSFQS